MPRNISELVVQEFYRQHCQSIILLNILVNTDFKSYYLKKIRFGIDSGSVYWCPQRAETCRCAILILRFHHPTTENLATFRSKAIDTIENQHFSYMDGLGSNYVVIQKCQEIASFPYCDILVCCIMHVCHQGGIATDIVVCPYYREL